MLLGASSQPPAGFSLGKAVPREGISTLQDFWAGFVFFQQLPSASWSQSSPPRCRLCVPRGGRWAGSHHAQEEALLRTELSH